MAMVLCELCRADRVLPVVMVAKEANRVPRRSAGDPLHSIDPQPVRSVVSNRVRGLDEHAVLRTMRWLHPAR
jgi:hypothetical protein